MKRQIGMDAGAARCTHAVISEQGRKLRDFPVETNGQALVEAIRMIPGHKHLVFEEGLQSAWLYETLSPHVDELVVAGITESRGDKSDKHDAYGLAEKLRVGDLDKPVFKAPREFTRLRELSRIHMTLVGDADLGITGIPDPTYDPDNPPTTPPVPLSQGKIHGNHKVELHLPGYRHFVNPVTGSSDDDDWVYKMHSRFFTIERRQFDAIHYAGMAFYKICILSFFIGPYLALRIMSWSQ